MEVGLGTSKFKAGLNTDNEGVTRKRGQKHTAPSHSYYFCSRPIVHSLDVLQRLGLSPGWHLPVITHNPRMSYEPAYPFFVGPSRTTWELSLSLVILFHVFISIMETNTKIISLTNIFEFLTKRESVHPTNQNHHFSWRGRNVSFGSAF